MAREHSAEFERMINEDVIGNDVPPTWEYIIDRIVDAQEALEDARRFITARFKPNES